MISISPGNGGTSRLLHLHYTAFTLLSVCAPHRPTFLLTVSCELLSSERGRAFLGVEIMGWKPSSATQRLSWQGKLCSDPGQVQSVLMQNGENRVTSLLLSQSHTYPTSSAVPKVLLMRIQDYHTLVAATWDRRTLVRDARFSLAHESHQGRSPILLQGQ